MKKLSLKSRILLGAILIGGSMAGAHAFVNSPNLDEPIYDWTAENNSPQNPGGVLPNATITQAKAYFGCTEGLNLCAEGEPKELGGESVFLHFD